MRIPKIVAVLAAGLVTTAATAQTAHDHAAMMAQQSGGPTEPGQGAFAAIAEIVAMLTTDPETDWAQVDIAALRQHLIDMDNLVTFAEATQEDRPDGAVFRASLVGPGGDAVGGWLLLSVVAGHLAGSGHPAPAQAPGQDAVDQSGGLAGAGAGLQQERSLELGLGRSPAGVSTSLATASATCWGSGALSPTRFSPNDSISACGACA